MNSVLDSLTLRLAPQSSYIVLITHGMMEHQGRYLEFTDSLLAAGISSVTYDLAYHGKFCPKEKLGQFPEDFSFDVFVSQLHEIVLFLKETHPSQNIVLFGHSLGSFITQSYASIYGHLISGMILSGSTAMPSALPYLGYLLTRILPSLLGEKRAEALIHSATFFNYNARVSEPKSYYDWICSDSDVLNRYLEDPACGFRCSIPFFKSLYAKLSHLFTAKTLRMIPLDMPIFLLSGKEDPLSHFGKGVIQLYHRYLDTSHFYVRYILYPGCRHEILNDKLKTTVYHDIQEWIFHLS